MEEKDKNKIHEDNIKRLLFALAVMQGSEAENYDNLSEEDLNKAKKIFNKEKYNKKISKLEEETNKKFNTTRLSEQQIQIETAKCGNNLNIEYYKIISPGDDKVCEACKKWINKIVSIHGEDPRYETVDNFIKSGGLHVNCRCSLQKQM